MIDVKKLIAGFLVLAIAAVGAGVVFSLVTSSSGKNGPVTTAGPQIEGGAGSGSSVPISAFVDTGSLQGNATEVLDDTNATSTDAQANDPDNLTNILASSFINELDITNPNGLTTIASGTLAMTPPNTQVIAQSIASNPVFQDISMPDWDAEAQAEPIATTTASQGAIAQYGDSISSIFNKYFVSNDLENDLNAEAADSSDLPYIYSQLQGALNDTLAVETPTSLLGLQQSLVRMFVYEENSVQLAENAGDDPVKAALIFQEEQSNYASAMNDLQQQIGNASSLGLSLNDAQGAQPPFIAELLGVQVAQAQWITFDATTFAQIIKQYLSNILLQIIKNTLIALIQKKVLTAIQGANGVPKFVTDFGTQMVNAYQSAALNTLNSELAAAPAYQSTALGVLLNTPYQSPTTIARSASQLSSPDSNISQLANGFTNYNDYFALFGQGGNVWSNAMTIQQDAAAAGTNSQSANQTQNIAQQGWSADETCSDGSNPQENVQYVCPSGTTPDPDLAGVCDGPNGSTVDATSIPTPGKCANGQNPTITNPGQVTGQSMNAALQSGTQLITSANDITGLVAALTTSLISQLAQQAITAATNAATTGGNNPGVGGISSSTITTSSSSADQIPIQCLPTIQSITISSSTGYAVTNVSAIGGTIDTTCATNGDCPSTVNPDGTPIYNWSAPGSVAGGTGTTVLTGDSLTLTYTTPGTYYTTVTASTDYTQASCAIDVTAP